MNNSHHRVAAALLLVTICMICCAVSVLAQEPNPRPPNPRVKPTSTRAPAPKKTATPKSRTARPREMNLYSSSILPMPPAAKDQNVPEASKVQIRVTLDKGGHPIELQGGDGHPLLLGAAWSHAKLQGWPPEKGERVKYTAFLDYTFTYMRIVLNPTSDDGVISGTIAYDGPAQVMLIDTSADPACGQINPRLETEDTVVKDGRLANVFVYIAGGEIASGQIVDSEDLRKFSSAAQTNEVVLDQKGCRFVPHVLGIRTNQVLKVTNSDPTEHGFHLLPKKSPQYNQIQANGSAPIERKFTEQEVMIPVMDNQHPWKKAYIGVLKHAFYAVTNSAGSFEIRGLPAGGYELVAWHEGGPNRTELEVTIGVTVNAKANASGHSRLARPTATNVAAFARYDCLRSRFLCPAAFEK